MAPLHARVVLLAEQVHFINLRCSLGEGLARSLESALESCVPVENLDEGLARRRAAENSIMQVLLALAELAGAVVADGVDPDDLAVPGQLH